LRRWPGLPRSERHDRKWRADLTGMRWLAESLAFSLRGLVSRRPRQSPDPTQSRRRVIYGVNTALGRRQFSQFYLDVLSIIQRLLAARGWPSLQCQDECEIRDFDSMRV
jgi:hypothetical protein